MVYVLRSVLFFSILRAVFSKRSSDAIQKYFETNWSETPPRGLAFVHRQARKYRVLRSPSSKAVDTSFFRNRQTSLNLFSFNLNELKRNLNNKDNDESGNEVLPAWVNALISYETPNLKSKSKSTGDKEDSQKYDNSPSSKSSPLTSLINVEALLMASGQIPTEEIDSDKSTLLLLDMLSDTQTISNSTNDINILERAQSEFSWNSFISNLQRNVMDMVETPNGASSGKVYETLLNQATQNLEKFLLDATLSVSPERIQSLIVAATKSLSVGQSADSFKSTVDGIVAVAESMAREQGLDVSEAAAQARATTKYTTEFLRVANGVLLSGYVSGTTRLFEERNEELAKEMNINLEDADNTKPLFYKYKSVQSIQDSDFNHVLNMGANMAKLSGGIYQDMIPTIHDLGHALVANGTVANVNYMVTDSIGYEKDFRSLDTVTNDEPILLRTVTLRGFDASDDTVDRESLLNDICNAETTPLSDKYENILVHRGMLNLAKEMYKEIIPIIDNTGPMHKVVLNGHSIGGSMANLLLLLMTVDKGSEYVKSKIGRVYTYGSPPVARLKYYEDLENQRDCAILQAMSLPSDMSYGYVQPWDPIVRLFSNIDAMYPLIGDLGEDGLTLWASGPARTLRPITRAILEAWEGWKSFRDANRYVMDQEYMHMGLLHILMPDPGRYLTDRLITVNINTYPVDEVLRISPHEFYSALEETFPLDVFSISLLPTSIRSFVHHFFPAYSDGMVDYVKNWKKNWKKRSTTKFSSDVKNEIITVQRNQAAFELADQATKWILGAKWD